MVGSRGLFRFLGRVVYFWRPRLRACRGSIPDLLTRQVPWSQGKVQGISPIQPLFTKISLENANEYSGFANYPRGPAGNYFAHAGNYFVFWAGAGNSAQKRSARPDASDCARK
jgi:hypothetical protein